MLAWMKSTRRSRAAGVEDGGVVDKNAIHLVALQQRLMQGHVVENAQVAA
jgi:hypothetical protein